MSFSRKKQTGSKISNFLINNLGQKFSVENNPYAGHREALRHMVAMEDIDSEELRDIETTTDNVGGEIRTEVDDFVSSEQMGETANFSDEQIAAGLGALQAAQDPATFMRNSTSTEAGAVTSSISGDQGINNMSAAVESYDESENRNTMVLSFAYNIRAARQDEFGEAFFPTQVVGIDEQGITVVTDMITVQENYIRKVNGEFKYQYDRQNVLRGLIDHNVFKSEYTDNIPVVRTENLKHFIDPAVVAVRNVENSFGESVPTAPLKVGVNHDLLALSQTDVMVQLGLMDQTDQLDTMVQLSTLYVKLASGDVLKLDQLNRMPEGNFVASPTGNDRLMIVNFAPRHMFINKDTKQADGTAITLATDLTTLGYTVYYSLTFSCSVNLDTAMTNGFGGALEITQVKNAAGETIPLDDAGLAPVIAEFATAAIAGYELKTRRVNTNKRERGQLLDAVRERIPYAIPVLSPISVLRPTTENEQSDAARIDSLVTSTYVRCSNSAVTALLEIANVLRQTNDTQDDNRLYARNIIGVGSYYVRAQIREFTLDVPAHLNSIQSSQRALDVQEALLMIIREHVADLYTHTGYGAVAAAIHGAAGAFKPKVVIGTDPYTRQFLQLVGDTRTLGDNFDVEIVTSWDKRVDGKIFVTFGKAKSLGDDAVNPFWFGNMYYRPQLVTVLNVSRTTNTTSRELTVHPQYTHVNHLPILSVITVKGLKEALTDKSVIATKKQP